MITESVKKNYKTVDNQGNLWYIINATHFEYA